jgi:hypothetical protein
MSTWAETIVRLKDGKDMVFQTPAHDPASATLAAKGVIRMKP